MSLIAVVCNSSKNARRISFLTAIWSVGLVRAMKMKETDIESERIGSDISRRKEKGYRKFVLWGVVQI